MKYVNLVKGIVKKLQDNGMLAIIDFHQDCWSPKFCGDGAPDWATLPRPNAPPFPEPIDRKFLFKNGSDTPSREDCSKHYWGLYCLSEAAASSYQSFYDNRDGILDAFAEMWQFLVKEMQEFDNIMGYEIINEPFSGDVFYRPDLFLPFVANNYNLLPMYDKVSAAIRKVDPNTLIFFEPITWSAFGTKFKRVPGGEQFQNSSIVSYHYYIPPCTLQEAFFPDMMKDMKRMNAGGMITEWDAIHNTTANMVDMVKTMKYANMYKQSWCAWAYDGWLKSYPMSKLLSQTYVRKVAGKVVEMSFDTLSGNYTLEFTPDRSITKLPTEIYLNVDFYYPRGYHLVVEPSLYIHAVEDKLNPNLLYLYNKEENIPAGSGQNVQVRIFPK